MVSYQDVKSLCLILPIFCVPYVFGELRCSILGKQNIVKYERFAKLLRMEFHSSVEFEGIKAFNIVTEKKW